MWVFNSIKQLTFQIRSNLYVIFYCVQNNQFIQECSMSPIYLSVCMTVLNKISMRAIIGDTWFKEKNLNNIFTFLPPHFIFTVTASVLARFSLYVPLYLLLETDPRNNNFWALQMCMLDAVPCVIFRVFCIPWWDQFCSPLSC